jgi:hypothetical protein
VVGPSEHDNDPSGSIKYGEFLEKLSDYQILNGNYAARSDWSLQLQWANTLSCKKQALLHGVIWSLLTPMGE